VSQPTPGTPVRVDQGQGHVEGTGGIPERFVDPGLPPHVPRQADHDKRAARRAEQQVAALFAISIVATVIFVVAYFAIDQETYLFMPGIGQGNLSNVVLGVTLGLSLLCIGLGAVHWAKTLMPDTEVAEDRHPQRSPDAARADAVETIKAGGEASQLARRPLIKYTLVGALGLVSLPPLLQLAGSLGPLPKADLSTTFWRKGMRLVLDPELTPVKATDVTLGSAFHILPEGIDKAEHPLEEKGKAAVVLVRLKASSPTPRSAPTWDVPWACTSRRPTTCCAPATSRPST